MRNVQSTMLTFLGGMVVGAVIVALTTPKTGKQLRESIRDFVEKESDMVREKAESVRQNANRLRNKMRDEISEKLEALEVDCER
jgi:gas vesicle protein